MDKEEFIKVCVRRGIAYAPSARWYAAHNPPPYTEKDLIEVYRHEQTEMQYCGKFLYCAQTDEDLTLLNRKRRKCFKYGRADITDHNEL